MRRADTIVILATPALSFATLAIGLGVGAGGETSAVIVEGAAPGADHTSIAWQLRLYRDDRGVREVLPNTALHIHAKYKNIDRAADRRTTADGAAEIVLDFAGIAPGDDVALEVTTDNGTKSLASGLARVPEPRHVAPPIGVLPSLQKKGPENLDVSVEGGALAVDLWTNLWVRATNNGKAIARDTVIQLEAIDGLEVDTSGKRVSDVAPAGLPHEQWSPICGDGWALFPVRAHGNNFQAKMHLGNGQWIGVLPTRLGATVAREAPPDAKTGQRMLEVSRAAGQETTVYVEIDDEVGRIWAATPTLKVGDDGFARVNVPLPDLGTKPMWAVAGTEPDSAEALIGGTTATPLQLVPEPPASCSAQANAAAKHPTGFPRTTLLDGFIAARARTAERRKKGMTIAVAALVIGAFVEAIVVLRGARLGFLANTPWITGKTATLVIGVGLAMLGFAMLGAFVLTH